MIIDVTFTDDAAIPPAVMLQALRHLAYSLESNLQRKPNAPFIGMGGAIEKGCFVSWLHFHTDPQEQAECRDGVAAKPSGDQDE